MATLKYKNPKTDTWVLLTGSGDPTEPQILFFKTKADFPDVGDATKMYIDTSDSRTYIFTGIDYNLVGDGFAEESYISAEDKEKLDRSISCKIAESNENTLVFF